VERGVGSTVLEAEDKGGQGSIWAVAPLERERLRGLSGGFPRWGIHI